MSPSVSHNVGSVLIPLGPASHCPLCGYMVYVHVSVGCYGVPYAATCCLLVCLFLLDRRPCLVGASFLFRRWTGSLGPRPIWTRLASPEASSLASCSPGLVGLCLSPPSFTLTSPAWVTSVPLPLPCGSCAGLCPSLPPGWSVDLPDMAPSQFALCSWPVLPRLLFSGPLGVYCVSRWSACTGTWSTFFMGGFLSAPATSPDRCCFVFLQCLSYGICGRLPGACV